MVRLIFRRRPPRTMPHTDRTSPVPLSSGTANCGASGRATQCDYAVPCALCYSLHAGRSNMCGCDSCARSYCSAACRTSDWTSHGHNHWCGKSAERGSGYQVCDAGVGRGEGIFALREFVAGDRIVVERACLMAAFETPVGSAALLTLPAGEQAALACLSSAASEDESAAVGDELATKLQRQFTNNAIDLGDDDHSSGLFLTIAKANHSCAGNSEHYYLAEHRLMLLVATTDIAEGEEITFSYVHDCATKQQRTASLEHWGIVCDCRACVVRPGGTASVSDALDKIARLDSRLMAQGSRGHISKALATGHRLLELYERSGLGSLMLASRTNFDMFGLAALDPSMRAEARQFLRASCSLDACFFGRSDLAVCEAKVALLGAIASSEGSDGHESLESSDGEAGSTDGGSVDDARTSDEDDWPLARVRTVLQHVTGSAINGTTAEDALAAQMADDGAAMIGRVLPRDECAAARRALLHVRDEGRLSHLFSSPTSQHAPPCAAECVWLCDAAFAAMARLDGTCTGGSAGGGGAAAARRAVDACAAEARRALATLGYDPTHVCQLGLPMASVGIEPRLAERFHRGHQGAPALHHRPRDGLGGGDAKSSRPSELILTTTLILQGSGTDHRSRSVSAPCTVDDAAGRSSSAAEPVDDTASPVAVLRTHVPSRAPAAACTAGAKRRRVEGAADHEEGAADGKVDAEGEWSHDGAPASVEASVEASVTECGFHPEVGDLLLIDPRTPRSLSGGRVSITMWWQLTYAAAEHAAVPSAAANTNAADATAASFSCASPVATANPSIATTTTTPTVASITASANDTSSSAVTSSPSLPVDAKNEPAVWDGILSRSVREALCAMPPVRFGVYDRSCPPCNAHEQLIQSLLQTLGDTSRYIEYWGRAVWRALPAHSDVDEIPLLAPLLSGSALPRPRFPLWAHVVYLDVAGGVAAPTVLWDDDHSRSRNVTIVPAVASRLLRFNGSWVHTVPKPAAEHLGEEQREADEVDEEARGGVLRHVLLFNSWPDAPPMGQPSRPAAGATATAAGDGARQPAANAPEQAAAKATPFDQWRPSLIVQHRVAADDSSAAQDVLSSTTALVARLMGGPRRRGRSERYRCDALAASRETVRDALYEPVRPSSFCVR